MLKKTSILLVFLLPASLIVLTKICPAKIHPISDKTVVSEAEARRMEAEERRAQREEARKARRAVKQAKAKEEQFEREFDFNVNEDWFGFDENEDSFGGNGNPVPPMMPFPMLPVNPNTAYGRIGDRTPYGRNPRFGTDGFEGYGYTPDEEFDGYGRGGFGMNPGFGGDFGSGFGGRF